MRRLLDLVPPPDAIFAANDLMALGAMMACKARGLRIPADVAVMGFDDIPTDQMVSPALTTVSQFQNELGRRAAELLFERIEGKAPTHGRNIEMPFDIVVRESASPTAQNRKECASQNPFAVICRAHRLFAYLHFTRNLRRKCHEIAYPFVGRRNRYRWVAGWMCRPRRCAGWPGPRRRRPC